MVFLDPALPLAAKPPPVSVLIIPNALSFDCSSEYTSQSPVEGYLAVVVVEILRSLWNFSNVSAIFRMFISLTYTTTILSNK